MFFPDTFIITTSAGALWQALFIIIIYYYLLGYVGN